MAGDIAASAAKKTAEARDAYLEGLNGDKQAAFAKLDPTQQQDLLLSQSAAYRDAYTSQTQWDTGGEYSRALQAVTTALVGGVSGQSGTQVASNALAPYAAQLIGRTFDGDHGSDPNAAAQLLSHALLGAVLAEANGSSGAGGALAGAGGEAAALYLTKTLYGADAKPSDLSEQDKQTILALSQAVGALVGGITGGSLSDTAVGSAIARNAVENNCMLTDIEINRIKELSKGDVSEEARLTAAACALVKCSAQYADGSEDQKFWAAVEAAGAPLKDEQELLSTQTYKNFGTSLAAKTGKAPDEQLFGYGFLDVGTDATTKWDNSNGHPFARFGGLLQTGAGAAAMLAGGGGCAETAISCVLVPWGADQTAAGLSTVATGETTSTLGGMLLSKTGLPSPYAEALYSLIGFVPSGAAAGLGRSATALPIKTLEPVNAVVGPADDVARATSNVVVNNAMGNSFDDYVLATKLSGLDARGLVATQERLPTPELAGMGKNYVKPDYTLYTQQGKVAAYADAKTGESIPFDLQARGLIDWSVGTESKTLIYYTPGGDTPISDLLLNYARQRGVKIKQVKFHE
ncbi:VENN motif pre-toxin domain-containing protein [Xanthomonas sacchari]|uniref:VENN motif pre-toxin domain-containing protein n=1 Tax=Xanthomonas sacchari TaxID=56458 RepID=UPI0020C410F0|nr:VENN motif pre-toxin domain-containing protein [Xanthomonas sacchari]